MNNASFAAQAVANGPMTAAPPSFDGHGWLLVLNLALMTATALIALGVSVKLANDLWQDRATNKGPLVALLRWTALIAFGGMTIRTGVEAVTLWGWNPLDPATTGWYLTLKRLLDPFGALAYFAAICLFTATEDALLEPLERKPWPTRLVAALPKLRRPIFLVVMSLIASIGVVSTR